jgi:L-ascorbate metabolism protein UlaG (beta-lactamase superfamily)
MKPANLSGSETHRKVHAHALRWLQYETVEPQTKGMKPGHTVEFSNVQIFLRAFVESVATVQDRMD